MPLGQFLRDVWSLQTDVLVLRTSPEASYKSGINGLGNPLSETLVSIRRLVDYFRYEDIHVLGVSRGTLPALFSADYLDATSAGLFGPLNPKNEFAEELALLSSKKQAFTSRTRLVMFAGSLATEDVASAEVIQEHVGGVVKMVKGADHNVMWHLFRKRKLYLFLRDVLLAAD